MPTLKQLEAFRWIVTLGSFEKAAERLNTTQSAVSKRIQELEARLGTPLLSRTQRSARLTVKGEAVFRLAEEMLGLRDNLLSLGDGDAIPVRHLRFGVTELTALTWLPAFVTEMRAAYPNVALEPEVEMSLQLFENLRDGEVDFIVVPDAFWQPGFQTFPLASVQNAWMCSPDLFPAARSIVRLEELAQFSILTQGGRSGSGLVFGKWLAECGVAMPKLITSNSLVAMVGLTIASIGISYLPFRCFQGLLDQGRLRVIETDPALPAVTYVMMFRADESPNLVRALTTLAGAVCDFSTPIRWA